MTEQEIREDERKRIAGILEEVAAQPDADLERAEVMRGLAAMLRIDTEELLMVGLTAIVDEIRAEEAASKGSACNSRRSRHVGL